MYIYVVHLLHRFLCFLPFLPRASFFANLRYEEIVRSSSSYGANSSAGRCTGSLLWSGGRRLPKADNSEEVNDEKEQEKEGEQDVMLSS